MEGDGTDLVVVLGLQESRNRGQMRYFVSADERYLESVSGPGL